MAHSTRVISRRPSASHDLATDYSIRASQSSLSAWTSHVSHSLHEHRYAHPIQAMRIPSRIGAGRAVAYARLTFDRRSSMPRPPGGYALRGRRLAIAPPPE